MKNIIYLIIIVVGFSACKKYEEGPFISFRSREERVANTWMYEKVIVDGHDATAELYAANLINDNVRYIFSKNGGLSVINTNNNVKAGKWEFSNKDNNVTLTYDDPAYQERWKIIKLKEKEFWFQLLDKSPFLAGEVWEFHLKPAN